MSVKVRVRSVSTGKMVPNVSITFYWTHSTITIITDSDGVADIGTSGILNAMLIVSDKVPNGQRLMKLDPPIPYSVNDIISITVD